MKLSVPIEALSFIFPNTVLDVSFPGGAVTDGALTSLSMYDLGVGAALAEQHAEHGIVGAENRRAVEFMYADKEMGTTIPCDWLETTRHPHGVTIAWAKPGDRGDAAVAGDWDPSVPWWREREDIRGLPERGSVLANEDGFVTVLDLETGRTDAAPDGSGEHALEEALSLFRSMSTAKREKHKQWGSLQTEPQRTVVHAWAANDSLRREAISRIGANVELRRNGTQWNCWISVNDENERLRIYVSDDDFEIDQSLEIALLHAYLSPNDIAMLLEQVLSDFTALRSDDWELIRPRSDATALLHDTIRGALMRLAVGDAIGTTVEVKSPGSFPPVADMTGGGPFRLIAGDWTDDTSMALCLAESLIECRAFDAQDQLERYLWCCITGHRSSTGACFDIGNTVSQALRSFEQTKNLLAGRTDEWSAGKSAIMRLAPIPLFFFGRNEDPIEMAAQSSRTTHGAAVAIDACRYMAAVIVGAMRGVSKDELLSPQYSPLPDYWKSNPLPPVIASSAEGSFRRKSPPDIRGTGYVAESVEAALWAFYNSTTFREGCLLATYLGDDADTTAAVFGQIAGAFYGESGIPIEWRERLTQKPMIDRFAEQLFQRSFSDVPALGQRAVTARTDSEFLLVEAGGDAAEAIRDVRAGERQAKGEMGVMAYHMNGSMHASAMRDETLLQRRVELSLSLLQKKGA